MANALDLLDPTVRDYRLDDVAGERTAESLARMRPEELGAYMAYKGGRGITSGAGQLVGGALGADVRDENEKYADSIRKVKDQIVAEGLDPSNSDAYYPRVIQLMAQNRLPSQAAAMYREYQKMKLDTKKSDLDVKKGDLELKKADLLAAKEARQATRDTNIDARAKERNETALKMVGVRRPEIEQLLALAEAPDATDARRKAYLARVNMLSEGKVQWLDAGNRFVPTQNGREMTDVEDVQKGAKPMSEKDTAVAEAATAQQAAVYKSSKDKLQGIYNSIVALANHPGLSDITGRIYGAIGGESGKGGTVGNMVLSDDGRAALALLEQVTGQAFLGALTQLKEASKTGATGLGAVTEREGDRVIAAAAALNRQQETGTFIGSLKRYAATVTQMGERMDEKAGTDQLVPLREQAFNPAPGKAAPAQEPPRADQRPTKGDKAPKAAAGRVRVRNTKTGAQGSIPADKLGAPGYEDFTEIK